MGNLNPVCKFWMLKMPQDARIVTADVTLIGVLEKRVVKSYATKLILSFYPPPSQHVEKLQGGHI